MFENHPFYLHCLRKQVLRTNSVNNNAEGIFICCIVIRQVNAPGLSEPNFTALTTIPVVTAFPGSLKRQIHNVLYGNRPLLGC